MSDEQCHHDPSDLVAQLRAKYEERDRLRLGQVAALKEQVAALKESLALKKKIIARSARIEALAEQLNAAYLDAIGEAWEAVRFETAGAAERAAEILRAALDAAERGEAE